MTQDVSDRIAQHRKTERRIKKGIVMEDRLSDRSWKEVLPQTFSWLEKLDLKTVNEVKPDSVCLLLAKPDKNKDHQNFTLDAPRLDKDLKDNLQQTLTRLGWSPKAGTTIVESENNLFVIVPTQHDSGSAERAGRQAGLDSASVLQRHQVQSLTITSGEKIDALDIFDGLVLGFYNAIGFKQDSSKSEYSLPQVALIGEHISKEKIHQVCSMAQATIITRILEDAPPNWLHSERFASIAQEISAEAGIDCSVQGKEEIRALGMGSFFSVSKGSPIDPKLITMEIKGKNPNKWVALIGKGLTFDSGGTNLKPSAGMAEMKYDMCGGASILGAAYYLSKVQPETNVVCMIGAVENILSGWANKPGDVVTAMNGKTIEILNTDAEGRLVLADLLHHAAEKYKPELMINTATLTGAVLMSLGSVGAALMSNKQKAADYVLGVAKKSGEPMWQLPLWPEFTKEVKSDIADLKNIASSSVKAGSIMAGVFLQEFVGKTPWVHLDIAGTGWNCKAQGFPSSGGSAFGLRTLAGACHMINEL